MKGMKHPDGKGTMSSEFLRVCLADSVRKMWKLLFQVLQAEIKHGKKINTVHCDCPYKHGCALPPGCEVFHYETQTKMVKSSHWTHMPNCTSALRWQNNYYCFHGNQFTKFHPVTGSVTGTYPKDARDYFMKCPNFGE